MKKKNESMEAYRRRIIYETREKERDKKEKKKKDVLSFCLFVCNKLLEDIHLGVSLIFSFVSFVLLFRFLFFCGCEAR